MNGLNTSLNSSHGILQTAVDWAKAEIYSSLFFIIFGLFFVVACISFWQIGKTEIAKAYVIPTLVAGLMLLVIGIGLTVSNKWRITDFPLDYEKNTSAFVESETLRVDKTMRGYQIQVFTIIPVLILVLAILIIFVNTPIWRAVSITTMAFLVIILMVDGTAYSRLEGYKEHLIIATKNATD